jgi:3D (Asp-Asp-Asp) domain-containing protein
VRHILLATILWACLVPSPAHAHRVLHHLPAMFATGYDERGLTATGTWAGPGTCAVDPQYIPLGAHIRIPGLGTCVARDTGGAIKGYRIDVWRSTAAECYALTGWYAGGVWWR